MADGSSVPMINTPAGPVAAPANCVQVCAPSKDMLRPGAYSVNDMNKMEAISQPLYSYQLYPVAGVATLSFFVNPVAGAVTLEDTNMQLAGQLPAPQKFLVQGLGIDYLPGNAPARYGASTGLSNSQINDVYAILRRGVLDLQIGAKSYGSIAPLMFAPPRAHINGNAAVSDATTAGANLVGAVTFGYSDGDVWTPSPLLLEAGQNFRATISFPGGVVPVPSGDTLARIGVILYGTLYRSPQ